MGFCGIFKHLFISPLTRAWRAAELRALAEKDGLKDVTVHHRPGKGKGFMQWLIARKREVSPAASIAAEDVCNLASADDSASWVVVALHLCSLAADRFSMSPQCSFRMDFDNESALLYCTRSQIAVFAA